MSETIPFEMTVGDRTYEIISILRGQAERRGRKYVAGHIMIKRAESIGAHLGEEDGEHILKHQNEIPPSLRDKVGFVFTAWSLRSDFIHEICCVYWDGRCWIKRWDKVYANGCSQSCRVLRRKS